MISANVSFSMYVVHGGTNFGLSAGYNFTTSYDYFSPINEQGRPTGKYHIFRSLIINYHNYIPQKAPVPIETMSTVLG
jgi:beta-galactosidase